MNKQQDFKFFPKLDSSSGYHQVCMSEEGVEETTFWTHHEHYELKIISFGLTNTLATFQALMNDISDPFLRMFVLMCFNNILVYHSYLEAHVDHLKYVLETLKANQLFVNNSKCIFGEQQVEYLEHVISAKDLACDPDKTETMRN